MSATFSVGRNPGCWVVSRETTERRWFRTVSTDRQYFRTDGQRLWEDMETGWFVPPDSELHAELNAAVAAYEPVEVAK